MIVNNRIILKIQYFPILAPSKTCWFLGGKYPPLNYDAVFIHIYTFFFFRVSSQVIFLAFHKVGCCVKNASAACHDFYAFIYFYIYL